MVFRTSGSAPAELVVLGSTRLDSYSLDKGEPLWWMPLASEGAIGTVVAAGDTIFASTKGSAEPMLGTFESMLGPHDKDKDKVLSRQEFATVEGWAEHFGWLDTDKNDSVTMEEWNVARNMGVGEFGAFAVRPGRARGRLDEKAVVWRFKRNLPYIPTPLLYAGALYLVKDGGIITSLDPLTGTMVKEGRAPEALGQYFASPVAADQKVFLAGVDGNVTVLKAGASWEVLGVNKLGEAIRATPALSGGRIYVRTEKALYCFGAQPAKKAAN
jgi:outer membrane protein assembly factor BamB